MLAITRHGSSTDFLTVFVLEKLGLHGKVKIQPMGGTREVDAAIRNGMVAGAVRSMKPGPKRACWLIFRTWEYRFRWI